jgi:Ca2+-transporting ATPase
VVLVSAGNDYRKQGQFRSLNDYSRGLAHTKGILSFHNYLVVRDGQTIQVGNKELMVGDVVIIETGDIIAADGVYISGFNLKCDESSLTGESDAAVKGDKDPFLISGTKVTSGVGRMLVIATGVYSLNGRIMVNLNAEQEDTPLQAKLTELADTIAKIGVTAALVMVLILIVAYFAVKTELGVYACINFVG